jgi:hypothetical protein
MTELQKNMTVQPKTYDRSDKAYDRLIAKKTISGDLRPYP